MPDYKKGAIYMLEPTIEYKKGDINYGSTTQPLYKRFHGHKKTLVQNRSGSSKLLFEKYGVENIKIILIKYFSCENKKELEAEEAKYIRENKCVNRVIPDRTRLEYYDNNKVKYKENQQIKYKNNKEIFNEKSREYYIKNREKIRQIKQNNYIKNKEKISEERKEKIICECGVESNKQHIKRHQATKKHINLLNKVLI